jgi:hypothetical protein
MAGKLITLPFRVWLGSARLLTRAAGGAAGRATSLAGQTLGLTSPERAYDGRSSGRVQTSPVGANPGWREESIAEPVSPAEVEHTVHTDTAVRPLNEEPEPPVVREPVHVSEEPVLVREEAEAGAEDGAGAQLRVAEPWNGYARMSARDVITRARQANAAELAAVRLYEARHRSRQTVLAAVDRQLKLASGPHPA